MWFYLRIIGSGMSNYYYFIESNQSLNMQIQLFIAILLYFFPSVLLGQKQQKFGGFGQTVNIKEFAGKNFILEASIKVNRIEQDADLRIFIQIKNEKKEQIFFQNSSSNQNFYVFNQWKRVFIKGKIDKNATEIFFGGIFFGQGVFNFDNFKFSAENPDGSIMSAQVPNGDFENDTILSSNSWIYFQPLSDFQLEKNTSSFVEGKNSLRISNPKLIKQNIIGDNDTTGKYVTVNGIDIYYETYGIGEPLILLHGNSESIASFKNQIPELSKYYRVIALDTRGQGKSGEDGKKYTYDLFADDLKAFLDYLKLDKVNILGWSDGGNTGLITAIKYPNKINKLITMGANIFIDNTVVDNKIFKLLNKQIKAQSKDSSYYSKNSIRLKTLLLTEPNHTFEDLGQIKIPVLVIAGERDVIKEEHTKAIAANIKNSILKIERNETHEFPAENPKLFNQIVLDFLKK